MHDWIQEQKASGHHKMALVLFPLVIFLGYIHPTIAAIGLGVFFLFTSFRLLKTMLFYMIILGAISLIFPPLAPVILIVMIILFIMRIGYVIKNWRPFLAGLAVYGAAGFLIIRMYELYYGYGPSSTLEPFIMACLAFFALKFILIWLYDHGYSSYAALGIMGSVPLIIISFILPFLKMHIGGDFFMPEATVAEGHATAHGGNATGDTYVKHTGDPVLQKVQSHVRTAPDGVLTNNLSYKGPSTVPVPTDKMVHVDDYVRTGADGDIQHVKAHVRTMPDGDLTNNLSYDGPDKKTPEVKDLVHVDGYVRTAPGGILENNLSYTENEVQAAYKEASAGQLDALPEEHKEKVKNVSKELVTGQAFIDRTVRSLKRNGES
ncbi:hypothetical protein ACFFJY_03190 [Fictibacillus aquaticus]|uniref:Uncharacterized protein n=1 Tax=Fictibacillus aquaticus TaxID=2021314 RepID=A0A235F8W7_9BACL|nr:hypothetical protein [Fictibacillus aquaticus]OYD57702.1 hypothetical protein CGZ90_13645 [Fictibacillus aquaticus]